MSWECQFVCLFVVILISRTHTVPLSSPCCTPAYQEVVQKKGWEKEVGTVAQEDEDGVHARHRQLKEHQASRQAVEVEPIFFGDQFDVQLVAVVERRVAREGSG
jgi:hypothetical protein